MFLSISCIHLFNSGIDNKVLHSELIKIYHPEVQVITGKVSSFAYNPKEKYRKQWLLAENKTTNLQVGLLLTSIFFFIVLLPKIFSVPADHIITSLQRENFISAEVCYILWASLQGREDLEDPCHLSEDEKVWTSDADVHTDLNHSRCLLNETCCYSTRYITMHHDNNLSYMLWDWTSRSEYTLGWLQT